MYVHAYMYTYMRTCIWVCMSWIIPAYVEAKEKKSSIFSYTLGNLEKKEAIEFLVSLF